MTIAVGDLVVRKSHGGDIVFKITDIYLDEAKQTHCVLKGLYMRLMADAPIDDVERIDAEHLRNEIIHMEENIQDGLHQILLRRGVEQEKTSHFLLRGDRKKYSFFNLPGKVLHVDGDEEYLKMCLKTYRQLNMEAVGEWIAETDQPGRVIDIIKKHRPDILILTGHDALTGNGKKDFSNMDSYRNSKYFVQSVINARNFCSSRDDLVIFAGACQSYFEAIIAAGANFASSPMRIFIHAYDPVFIAEKVAFTSINQAIDLNDTITAAVTGVEGVGGIETRGKFRLGLPKTPY
ncbi:spore coat assembly protein [Sporomusaceae bacterium BoRhaA]|uniref:sporulation peptidase YabG n=1 Tax=Pelorhabdus rhamnosifermentans TaxID=2772457 RepID=UPI0028A8FA99|nr:sporulation peptidase YabG [Pelorhabdus rhamnosifermentans]MBU2702115.1 spore coat assembly protein [Pelorhabdus rhamnosifermentans]